MKDSYSANYANKNQIVKISKLTSITENILKRKKLTQEFANYVIDIIESPENEYRKGSIIFDCKKKILDLPIIEKTASKKKIPLIEKRTSNSSTSNRSDVKQSKKVKKELETKSEKKYSLSEDEISTNNQDFQQNVIEEIHMKQWKCRHAFKPFKCQQCKKLREQGEVLFHSSGIYYDKECIELILAHSKKFGFSDTQLENLYRNFVTEGESKQPISNKKFKTDSEKDIIFEDEILKTIPQFVYLGLMKKGKTISEIFQNNAPDPSNHQEEEFRDVPVWHSKKEIDEFVKHQMNLTDEKIEKMKYEDGKNKFYYKIVQTISQLRNNDQELVDWVNVEEKRPGVWRLRNIHVSNSQNTTIDELEDDPELKEIDPNELEEGINEIKKNFLFDEDTIKEIVINLIGRRHIILAGPVGTGKTELARMIPRIFWKENQGYFTEEYTATADWNTTDVIGGIMPKMKGDTPSYEIQLGCVSSTILKNWEDVKCQKRVARKHGKTISNGTWLLIDEFNRADIDKAFGPLFTSLESKNLKIPSSDEKNFSEIKIPKDYRIIGTLNTADKSYLFHLSDALKRRFAYIEVNPPGIKDKDREIFYALKNALTTDSKNKYDSLFVFDESSEIKRLDKIKSNIKFLKILEKAYYILYFIRMSKPLGTAVLKSIYQTILVSTTLLNNFDKALDIGLKTNLIPQLENISPTEIETIKAIFFEDPIKFFKQINNEQNKEKYENNFLNFLKFIGLSDGEAQNYVRNFSTSLISDSNWEKIQDKITFDFKLNEKSFKKSLDELENASTLI